MKHKQLYLINVKSEYFPKTYIGTYKPEGKSLVRLNILYYWDIYCKLKRKRTIFRSSSWSSGWSKRNIDKIIIIPALRIDEIKPLSKKELNKIIRNE